MTGLSAVLITLDEAERLPAALASVAFCEEIVVVDAGSQDATRELAIEAGARVVDAAPWPGFVAQRKRAVAAARHDWILSLDADERVSASLADEIRQLMTSGPTAVGYRVPRIAFYLGRWIRGTDWYPDLQLRLFDRRRGRFEGGLVHEAWRCDGSPGRLRGELEHRPYRDVSDHLQRIDRYTSLWAEQAAADGRRAGYAELALAAPLSFLRNYLLKGGVWLGGVGLTVSVLNSYYAFAKLAKLRERQLPRSA